MFKGRFFGQINQIFQRTIPRQKMSTQIDELAESLDALKTVSYTTELDARNTNAKAEHVLFLIYRIGLKKTAFTEKQKKRIGSLMPAAIKPLQKSCERSAILYRRRLKTSDLKKRSALQFLVDDYANFPVGDTNSTLKNEFDGALLPKTIEMLDELIGKWYDASDSDDPASDRENSGAPSSHTWWPV